MTTLRKIILIPALAIVSISAFVSCGVDRWPEYAHLTELDTWMYDIMQQNYLWYQEMPPYGELNLFQTPDRFLAEVKSSSDNYSFVDTVMATPLPSYGFDYSLIRNPDIDTAYNALITYVIPGSPAAAVLKRGDWIVKVDTSYISKKYELQLLQGTQPIEVTLGTYQLVPPTEPPVEGEEPANDIYRVVPASTPVEIGAAVPLTDNPIHHKEILTLADGGEVGYLMYNSFTPGTPANPEEYNDALREWSNTLWLRGIHKVILDLRYNKGGSIDCVQLLSTILAPTYYMGQTMASLEYNDKNAARNTTLTFDAELLNSVGKNLDVTTLIVLTSGDTAGASEMLIHSLNGKVRELITVGASTKGQNVATERFVNEKFLWSANVVVSTIYNSEHETYSGFQATYTVNAATDYLTFLPFGDENEALISVALGVLNKTYPPGSSEGNTRTPLRIEKSVVSPASRVYVGGSGIRL